MKSPIKVLHVIKTFNLGGAETNLLNLATAFDSEKVETHVAYSFGGELEEKFRRTGLRLFKYAKGSHRVKSFHTPAIVLRLASYMRQHEIDIVHTHNFNAHIWGLIAAKLVGVKVIEHVHDHRYTPPEELIRRHALLDQYRFIKYFRNQSHRVVVLTKSQVESVIVGGFCVAEHVLELRNGITMRDHPTPSSESVRRRLDIPADAIVVLSSSRIEPAKNIELILRIAARLVDHDPRALFLIAGDGPYLEEYRSRCRDLHLERKVRFIGFHPNMYDLMAASDIYMAPSLLELHSIAILEAMKTKLPLVVSQGVGCNDEFIQHGRNGFLCDPFQDEPWLEALKHLLNDRSLRTGIGVAGYETCRRLFDIRDTAVRFEKLYAQVTA